MIVDDKNKIAYVADKGGNINIVFLASSPPMMKQVIRTSSEGSIRGIVADFQNRKLYCTCFEDGYIHIFKLVDPTDPEGRVDKVLSVKGAPNPRVIKLWPERNEVVVGHQDGLISFYNFELNQSGPFYSAKIHDKNINALQTIPQENMLITGSGDKSIRVKPINLVLGSSSEMEQRKKSSCEETSQTKIR
jgi:WD40 repeat protein